MSSFKNIRKKQREGRIKAGLKVGPKDGNYFYVLDPPNRLRLKAAGLSKDIAEGRVKLTYPGIEKEPADIQRWDDFIKESKGANPEAVKNILEMLRLDRTPKSEFERVRNQTQITLFINLLTLAHVNDDEGNNVLDQEDPEFWIDYLSDPQELGESIQAEVTRIVESKQKAESNGTANPTEEPGAVMLSGSVDS